MNHLQLWIARLTAVLIADQLVDLWITSRWRWPADGPKPTRVLVIVAVMELLLIYGWWRVMRWIERRPLDPERRARVKVWMWLALITGVINVNAAQFVGDLDAFGWLSLPVTISCGIAATTVAGAATAEEVARHARVVRRVAIFIAGCVVVNWVLFGYWLTPPSAS